MNIHFKNINLYFVFLSTIFQILFVFITSYFIYATFKNSSACKCRNIILQCKDDFDKLLMWNLNDDVVSITNFDVLVLKTIIIVVWNTKILVIFSLVQIVLTKSFEDFRTLFFFTMLISSMRKLIFLEISTFKNAFSISKKSFHKFDEWEQRKLFFRKEILFSLFNNLTFRESEIISLFFIETFCLDILIVTKMLIVDVDSNSDNDVSLNVDNWKISIDDEIFFSSSISRQHSFENYLIRVFVLIFCRIIFHRCSQIFATKSHDTLHKTFFLLFWKDRQLRTCRKILFRWMWRRDNHLRHLSLNFKLERC
jgi:hypothetical protein